MNASLKALFRIMYILVTIFAVVSAAVLPLQNDIKIILGLIFILIGLGIVVTVKELYIIFQYIGPKLLWFIYKILAFIISFLFGFFKVSLVCAVIDFTIDLALEVIKIAG